MAVLVEASQGPAAAEVETCVQGGSDPWQTAETGAAERAGASEATLRLAAEVLAGSGRREVEACGDSESGTAAGSRAEGF